MFIGYYIYTCTYVSVSTKYFIGYLSVVRFALSQSQLATVRLLMMFANESITCACLDCGHKLHRMWQIAASGCTSCCTLDTTTYIFKSPMKAA